MMNGFFKQDRILTGIVLAVGSELAVVLLLWIALLIAGVAPGDYLRWFGACFIPPVLILRHYAKNKDYPTVTKTIIITLFITFLAFMYMVRNEF